MYLHHNLAVLGLGDAAEQVVDGKGERQLVLGHVRQGGLLGQVVRGHRHPLGRLGHHAPDALVEVGRHAVQRAVQLPLLQLRPVTFFPQCLSVKPKIFFGRKTSVFVTQLGLSRKTGFLQSREALHGQNVA